MQPARPQPDSAVRPSLGYPLRFVHGVGFASALLTGALMVGVLGYHFIAHLAWIDALLNAAMILTGMGPVDPMPSTAAKFFASFYALFSGLVFLTAGALVLSPMFHRILHHFHIEDQRQR